VKKRIGIFGSTGSIGAQTLEVIKEQSDYFEAEVLTANHNADLLIRQALEFNPNVVVIGNKTLYNKVFEALNPHNIKVYAGEESITQVMEMDSIDQVLMAIVGFDGLAPTLAAIQHHKSLALANKESLVVAGNLIRQQAMENKSSIIPVDSEHNAIFQCLMGEGNNPVEKVVLTASGGPFRGFSREKLEKVTPAQALKHPVWQMGDKVSIDSATLMNKGLEVIEASWLFNLGISQLQVVVHPESLIHSLVFFTDGTVKSQMSQPDMRIPIQVALSYPRRFPNKLKRLDFIQTGALHFELPDIENFRNLALAFEALEKGGNLPCILNAANEIAVQAFLREELGFLQIPELIERCMQSVNFIHDPGLEDYIKTDQLTRIRAKEIIKLFD